MIDAPLALALASGLVAAVNPCGFAMLPAYVTFFLGREDPGPDGSPARTVARAVPVALTVSGGFIVVFGVVGVVLRSVSSTIQEHSPWATMVIGAGLIALGVAMVAGREITVPLPRLDRGGRTRGLGSMFLFGVSYAIASLSCTLGIFVATIVNAFNRTDFVSGVAVLLTYAFGMSLVLTAVTLATALTRGSVVRGLRSSMPYVNRVGGGLMVLMGAYLAWYGVYSLRVREDPLAAAGPVALVESWSARAEQLVADTGALRLAGILGALVVAAIAVAVLVSSLRRQRPLVDADRREVAT